MGKDSHDSLFSITKIIEQRAKESATLNRLVTEIKAEYKNNGGWSESIINKKKSLESKITSVAYFHYSGNRPDSIVGLTIEEQKIFLSEFKQLLIDKNNIEVRVQGKNDDYFSQLTDHDLLDGTSYRFLPKDYIERYKNHSMLMSRLTINVKKENFISLSKALIKLYENDPNKRVMQSKIMGPKNLGKLTDQAVIYFSNANLQDAIEISQQLKALLPADALIEHVPIGMYRVDKGISYSETLKGQSSSHGEARAEIIAKAVTESLLTEKSVDKCLENQLRIHGYDVEHPALLAQSVREAYIDISLAGGGYPSERLPSKNIEIFKQDPIRFSQQYIINTKELNAILQAPHEGKVIFTKGDNNNYLVELVDDSDGGDKQSSIESYFLESKIRNKESKQVEYIDISIKNPEKNFLFTGLLHGDSVVVTELNSETYRVYRDNRADASLLYDNVVMAVDERDYNNKENNTTKASLFMHHENGKWKLILQPQKGKYFTITENNSVQVQLPGDYLLPIKQQRFDIYRNKTHQELKVAAKKFNITFSDIPTDDGLFEIPSEQNTSVRTWLDIGEEIKRKLDLQISTLNQSREKLEVEFSQTADNEKKRY